MSDFEANVRGVGDVMAAADRLAALGLASAEPPGLNNDGVTALADLLAVLVFQTGRGQTHAEQVMSATARAAMSALGDLIVQLGGETPGHEQTLQLLTAAVRTARS